MALLRPKGRIALCGAISRYNENVEYEAGTGPNTIMTTQMLYTHQRIEGFVCSPWLSGQKGNFLKDMHRWMRDGKLVVERVSNREGEATGGDQPAEGARGRGRFVGVDGLGIETSTKFQDLFAAYVIGASGE